MLNTFVYTFLQQTPSIMMHKTDFREPNAAGARALQAPIRRARVGPRP